MMLGQVLCEGQCAESKTQELERAHLRVDLVATCRLVYMSSSFFQYCSFALECATCNSSSSHRVGGPGSPLFGFGVRRRHSLPALNSSMKSIAIRTTFSDLFYPSPHPKNHQWTHPTPSPSFRSRCPLSELSRSDVSSSCDASSHARSFLAVACAPSPSRGPRRGERD